MKPFCRRSGSPLEGRLFFRRGGPGRRAERALEDLDRGRAAPHVDLLAGEAVRRAVVVRVHTDVVIRGRDALAAALPAGGGVSLELPGCAAHQVIMFGMGTAMSLLISPASWVRLFGSIG
jgi:hypothetical protein